MNPYEFLSQAHGRLTGLSDAALAACNEEERALVRSLEETAQKCEFDDLSDLITNCRNRFQFAKTYATLSNDIRKTFAQSNKIPDLPEHVSDTVLAAMKKIGSWKLAEMAIWFEHTFADAHDRRQVASGRVRWSIEVYAGKEGKGAGFASVILFAAGACLFALAVRYSI